MLAGAGLSVSGCVAGGLDRPASTALELAFLGVRKPLGGVLHFEFELQTQNRRLENNLLVLKEQQRPASTAALSVLGLGLWLKHFSVPPGFASFWNRNTARYHPKFEI